MHAIKGRAGVKEFLKKLGELLLNLVYPRRAVCMGCGNPLGCDRDDLCEVCHAQLAQNWVGVRTPDRRLRLDGAAFAHAYFGPAGGMVRRLKYHGAWVLAESMGADVARAAAMLRLKELRFVTAVPMHPRRLRLRGRNHAELIARQVAARMGVPYAPLLMRTRNAPQQARLGGRTRRNNQKGGFALRPEWRDAVAGAEVLLIDDVFTTGATAAGCAEPLRAAGARRVWFAAYAIGERSSHG